MNDYYGTIPVVWQGPYARLIPRRRRSKIDLLVAIVWCFKDDEATLTLIGDLDAAIDALDTVSGVTWHERGRRVTVPLNVDSRGWIISRVLPRIGLARRVQHIMIAIDGVVQFIAEDYFAVPSGVIQTGPAVTERSLNSLVVREMIDGYEWIETSAITGSSTVTKKPTPDVHLPTDDGTDATTLRQGQIIPMLLEACPDFSPTWQNHLAWWADDDNTAGEPVRSADISDEEWNETLENPRGYYNDIYAFASYLLRRLRDGTVDEFPAAFAAIERLMTGGDDDVRQLLTIGLFEDLSDNAEVSAQCLQWAGPYTRAGWYWVYGVRYLHSSFYELIAREIELRRSVTDSQHPGA